MWNGVIRDVKDLQTDSRGSRADARAVRTVLGGRPEAFEELVVRHQKTARAVALGAGVPPDRLNDVLQESFLRALRKLRDLRRPEMFGPWLVTIVRNAAKRLLRDARRLVLAPSFEREGESHADAFERGEFNAYLWDRVQELPRDVREAIFLYYYEGGSVRKVASSLGVTIPAVKNRLQRGRDLLRERLWREMGSCLRDMLPSVREWRRSARRLTLLALAALPSVSSRAAAGAGAPSSAAGVSQLGSFAGAGLLMAVKKSSVAALALVLVFFALGVVAGYRSGGASGGETSAGVFRGPEAHREPALEETEAVPAVIAAENREPEARAEPENAAVDETPSAGSLRVRAVWESGEPAVGLLIHAVPGFRARPELLRLEGVTDSEGSVLFEGVAPGEVLVRADRSSPRRGRSITRISAGETTTVLVRLAGDLTVRGVVVDADGRGVAGAEVRLSEGTFNSVASNLVTRAATDGTFELRGVQRGRFISARAPGWAPSSQKIVHGERGETISVRLVLPARGGALRGRVVDRLGAPVAGAMVAAGERTPVATWTAAPAPVRVWTPEDGSFELDGIGPGAVPVLVRAADLAPAEMEAWIEPGRVTSLDVVLEPGVTVSGRVVDADGVPAAGAEVRVGEKPRGYAAALTVTESRTGPDGTYRLAGLPAGRLRVDAAAKNKGHASGEIEAAAGGVVKLDFVLPGSLDIAGRVVLEDGKALRGALVSGSGLTTQFTDGNGRFAFRDCEDREYSIRVQERGHRFACAFRSARPSNEELLIAVKEEDRCSSWIEGTVVGKDGRRRSGVEVRCEAGRPFYSVARSRSGFFGGFRIGPLPPGTFKIALSAEGFPRVWVGEVSLRSRETRDLGAVALREPGFLEAVFRSEAPGAAEGLRFVVLDAEGRALLAERLSAEPSRRDPLTPGRHRLRVARGETTIVEKDIEIRVGEETVLEIELPADSAQERR